jgi:hypothetical protein
MTAIGSATLEAGGWTSLFGANGNFPRRRVFQGKWEIRTAIGKVAGDQGF